MLGSTKRTSVSTNFQPIQGQELAHSYKQTGREPQKVNETALLRIRGDGLSNSFTIVSVLTLTERESFNLKELAVS